MNDDIIRCILEHACKMQALRNVRPLVARRQFVKGNRIDKLNEDLLSANGIMGRKETILVGDVRFVASGHHEIPIWASDLDKRIDLRPSSDMLCLLDVYGNDSFKYDNERARDGSGGFPCVKWGEKRQKTYSIRLSRAVSMSVVFDVVVIPTSWWFDECDYGYWQVIQVVKDSTGHSESPDSLHPDANLSIVQGECATFYVEVVGYHDLDSSSSREDEAT